MRGHNIHFYKEIWKIVLLLSLLPVLIWITIVSRCSLMHKLEDGPFTDTDNTESDQFII